MSVATPWTWTARGVPGGCPGGAQGGAHALIRETASASLDGKRCVPGLYPLSDPGDAAARLCAVGTWTAEVFLLTMPDLRLVTTSPLGGGGGRRHSPRGAALLLRGDAPPARRPRRRGASHLRRRPRGWHAEGRQISEPGHAAHHPAHVRGKGATHVFAGSDRPTVIYGNNGKLIYPTST